MLFGFSVFNLCLFFLFDFDDEGSSLQLKKKLINYIIIRLFSSVTFL